MSLTRPFKLNPPNGYKWGSFFGAETDKTKRINKWCHFIGYTAGKKIIAAEKWLELTVSDEKETQNIFNERKIY